MHCPLFLTQGLLAWNTLAVQVDRAGSTCPTCAIRGGGGRFDMACHLNNVWPKSEGMGSSTPEFVLVFQYKKGSIKFQKTRDVKSWI